MFPFFPFGPVPPFPFLFPFGGYPWASRNAAETDGSTSGAAPFGTAPPSLMTMALMPAMAPFALGSQMARVAEDARHIAMHVKESLEKDDGPVHVMVGDPDGPLGVAIGLTFLKRGQTPQLRDAGPARVEAMVDVTPKPAA
ncbi:hypothetical protein [uncultured Rhodospira sp.]|uniref:hypothetical protein n=1 Tax=uncultured Rhodospira sp. TaxID=1936189 RepID=UPI00263448F2|nr:hypothetical protein [uncultured Rhodospira sp.]